MNQADENGSGSKPGKLPTTEHNRKDTAADDRAMTTDEALAALLSDLKASGQVSTTLEQLGEAWTTTAASARKRLQRWEERGHVICAWPGGGQVLITSKLSTQSIVDTPAGDDLSTVDSRGQPNVIKGLPRKLFPVDTNGEVVTRVIDRYVDNPVDSRGHGNLSTVDTRTDLVLSTDDGVSTNVVQFRRPAIEGGLAREIMERTEELKRDLGLGPEPVQPNPPVQKAQRTLLPFFRPSQGLRLVAFAAVSVSIAMIAYHSAGAAAANVFIWATTLAMAVILSTGKVVLGTMAEGFIASRDRGPASFCVVGALFLLCVDASLLYAFRGDSLSNAAAMEKAAMETRGRLDARLKLLTDEQQRLVTATGPTTATDVRLVAEVEADLGLLENVGDCRMVTPRRTKKNPNPEAALANPKRCETSRAVLAAELARAKDAAGDEARSVAAAEKREKRLAELPDQIAKAEIELGQMQARATPDHGASIVARGLNWIPAGVASAAFGVEEFRPVEGRGVEIFWSWAFVLAAELFAVGGFAIAARSDRKARQKGER